MVDEDFSVEFIGARPRDDRWWLHIRIDGHEGLVGGSKDLTAIGLPDAG